MSDPDTALMVRFTAGDEAAFDTLVRRFERQVFGVIHKYIGNAATAEDCAQEVFLKLYKLKRSYRPTARLSTLVYRITSNLCLNLIRDEARRRAVSLDESQGSEETTLAAALPETGTPEVSRRLEDEERAGIVRRALDKIPDRQRMALVLHRFEGLSYAEIAEALDANTDAVKALLSRARQSLAEALKKDIEAGNI